jgi:hypothetical protein
MRLLEDRLLRYRGYHGCRSECRVRLFAPEAGVDAPGTPHAVIATELETNPGTSVTNAAERLAWDVWCYLEKPEAGLTWIEHYPDRCFLGGQGASRRPMLRESFDLVSFDRQAGTGRFLRPRWRRVSRFEVEALTGAPLGAA